MRNNQFILYAKSVYSLPLVFFVTCLLSAIPLLSIYSQVTPRHIPETNWNFTEQSGSVTYAGPVHDSAYLIGNTTWATDPIIGSNIHFGKTASLLLSDKINTGITDVFTITCWLKAAPALNDRVIVAQGKDKQSPGYFCLALEHSTGYLSFYAPGFSGDMSSGFAVADNKWHQVAVTYVPGSMKFYKDGDLVKMSNVTGHIKSTVSLLTIGANADRSNSFDGNIARLKITAAVLNAVKIRDLHTNKLAGWDLTEGMGIATYQDQGNPLYGMLQGPINTYDNYGAESTGRIRLATWIADDKFGNVLDFTKKGAVVLVDSANVNIRYRFTIACWIKIHAGRGSQGVILAKGADCASKSFFKWTFNPATNELYFYSPSLTGNTTCRMQIGDSKWHHIAVIYTAGRLQFYKDGSLSHTATVNGTISDSADSMFIGCDAGRFSSFPGCVAHLRIFGSAFTPAQLADLYNETETAGWNFNEGQGELAHSSNNRTYDGKIIAASWVPGKGSSFSKVLGFNQPGSGVQVTVTDINLAKKFTIAAWVQTGKADAKARTLLAKGKGLAGENFNVGLAAGNGNLFLRAAGLSGDMNSGFAVDDQLWHHIMITYGNGTMKFYKDRRLIKATKVTGSVSRAAGAFIIGNDPELKSSFRGNLAQVKMYNSVKIPEEVTTVVPPAGPALILKRGIVFDRIQNQGFPVKEEWQIAPNDIAVAKAIGFDHIKALFTADEFISESGINMANMGHVDKVVNMVLASGLPCVVCLHPEGKFKARYVGTDSGFRQMLGFYKAFARYLSGRWSPKQVAFQLMTEPFGNKDGEWNRINDEMVATVRCVMPDHTLIVSGDRAGNIYAMTGMVPLQDKNIYYSFTTYEPYRFGFNTLFGGWRGSSSYWKDISYVPWPTSPEIVASRMDEMLSTVKDADRQHATEDLVEYGKTYFNPQWLRLRAKNVNEWNDLYGGNIHILVAEFGAVDNMQRNKPGASHGVYPQERVRFVHDLRQSFESVGMGWEYWSFNEYFTILNPALRKPYGPATIELVDKDLVHALGLEIESR